MGYYVYIIRCSDGLFYTGITSNLLRRLSDHQAGLSVYTKQRLPVELVYKEKARNRKEARKRELIIKDMSRKKKIDLINKFTSSVNEKRR